MRGTQFWYYDIKHVQEYPEYFEQNWSQSYIESFHYATYKVWQTNRWTQRLISLEQVSILDQYRYCLLTVNILISQMNLQESHFANPAKPQYWSYNTVYNRQHVFQTSITELHSFFITKMQIFDKENHIIIYQQKNNVILHLSKCNMSYFNKKNKNIFGRFKLCSNKPQ